MRLRQAFLLLILTACVPRVTVTPAKGAPSVPSKPDDCEIEFFATDTLQRPYDALAELRVTPPTSITPPTSRSGSLVAKETMRQQACLIGADAVIGLHEAVSGVAYTLVGTAVRYRQK